MWRKSHYLECSVILSEPVKQKSAFDRKKQHCLTCLQSGHMARGCSSKLKGWKMVAGSHITICCIMILLRLWSPVPKNGMVLHLAQYLGPAKGLCRLLSFIEKWLFEHQTLTCLQYRWHPFISENVNYCLGLVGFRQTVCVRGVTGFLEGDTWCFNLELFSLEDESFIPLKVSA